MLIYSGSRETQSKIRVWRSLVSRLNGVQEAAGSTPVTRTIINKSHNLAERISFFKIMVFYYFLNDFILRHLTNSNKLVIEKFIQNMYNRIKLL